MPCTYLKTSQVRMLRTLIPCESHSFLPMVATGGEDEMEPDPNPLKLIFSRWHVWHKRRGGVKREDTKAKRITPCNECLWCVRRPIFQNLDKLSIPSSYFPSSFRLPLSLSPFPSFSRIKQVWSMATTRGAVGLSTVGWMRWAGVGTMRVGERRAASWMQTRRAVARRSLTSPFCP